MFFEDLRKDFQDEIVKLERDLQDYRRKPRPNENYIVKQQELITNLKKFDWACHELLRNQIENITSRERQLLEIVKKQALIIQSAKIEFPTIHQSLDTLWMYYFANTGKLPDEWPDVKKHQVKIG